MGRCDWGRSSRMLKKSASGVLSRVSPCDVPSGYASVAPLPAALLDGLFEHPAREVAQVVFSGRLGYS
jgi:hypothetical protein